MAGCLPVAWRTARRRQGKIVDLAAEDALAGGEAGEQALASAFALGVTGSAPGAPAVRSAVALRMASMERRGADRRGQGFVGRDRRLEELH